MRDPDQFDAFYAEARQRLLLQTYALTGDMPAARSAVRDAFVGAWHHWHKISRHDDPEAWVRPRAWRFAQRRHTARLWHRDRTLTDDHRATLDALGRLPGVQRRALLLDQLAGVTGIDLARELGLPPTVALEQMQLGAAQLAVFLKTTPERIGEPLQRLSERTGDIRLPRMTIVRRAGTARRRTHTGFAALVAASALLVSGGAVTHGDGVTPLLGASRGDEETGPGQSPDGAQVTIASTSLLTPTQLTPLGRGFDVLRTGGAQGAEHPCDARRFADPERLGGISRDAATPGKTGQRFTQVVERSTDETAAATAYDTALGWYSSCDQTLRDTPPRMQLLDVKSVSGAGDEAMLLVMRSWAKPVETYSVAVARTGDLVTTLVQRVDGTRAGGVKPLLEVLDTAVTTLCGAEGGGTCPTTPRATEAAPPPAASDPGMLQAIDLAPVGVDRLWTATEPTAAGARNPAATTCDRADFSGKGITKARTRSFLIPESRLPTVFGASETIGTFGSDKAARAFLRQLHGRLDRCEDRDLTATVTELRDTVGKSAEVHTWKVTIEVSDTRSVDYYVALIRRGNVVAEVGFVPARGADFGNAGFVALAERALARLENLG